MNGINNGVVHGGQNPVSGATVQLWQVGQTGYGLGASPLGSSTTTANDGSFSITGDYSCTAAENGANTLAYITATGGNPGSGPNSAISMMTALGTCGSLTPSTFISINELSTVVSVVALAQFMNTTGSVGSYGSFNQGLVNAFANVNNLLNVSQGTALTATPYGNGVVPQAEINSLANSLAACVNSTGPSSTACSSLFTAATPPGGTPPATALVAALDIALNPGNNVSAIYGLAAANSPFLPALTSAPNDWTIAVSFSSTSSQPYSLALDKLGNVWVANYNGGGTASNIGLMSNQGVPATNSPYSNPAYFNAVEGIAVDGKNQVWVANYASSSIMELAATSNGSAYTITPISNPYSPPGMSAPDAIAVDGYNNIWVANYGNNSVTELYGGTTDTYTYTSNALNGPKGIAIDPANNAWVANSRSSSLAELYNGNAFSYAGGGINTPDGIAVDGSGDVWATDATLSEVAELNNSGTPISSGSGYTGGGLTHAYMPAIDGSGNLWVPDYSANQLTELTNAGAAITSSTGYRAGSLAGPDALAVDESGDVWVTNNSAPNVNGVYQTLTEFIGLASPVITPLAAALQATQLGSRPGTPVPVSIVSSLLPNYATGTAQSDQLYAAGGNSGTYVWSSASALPAGLALSSSGLISGTTNVAGSTTITVKACDANNLTNCASQPFTLSSTSSLHALGNEIALSGTYAIRYSGFQNGTGSQGAVYGDMIVGSLTFNGAGLITGGEMDFMGPASTSVSTVTGVTGYYAVGTNNLGTIEINLGSTREFAISVGNFNHATAQTIHLISFVDSQAATGTNGGDTGAGIGKLQTPSAFSASTLNSTFVFGLQGESPCTDYLGTNPTCAQTIEPFGPIDAVGYFTGNGAGTITAGEEDASASGEYYNSIPMSGLYTNPDTYGRGTITLSYIGLLYLRVPTHFVYYLVNGGEMFLSSTDGHATYTLLSGDALVQASGVFSATNPNPFSGNYVGYTTAPANGDGVSIYPTESVARLELMSASGSQFTITSDQNNAGQFEQNVSAASLAYTTDAVGRTTFPANNGSFVGYFANTGLGFFVDWVEGSDPGLITVQQQTGGPFTSNTFNAVTAQGGVIAPSVFSDTTVGTFVANEGGTSGTNTYFDSNGYVLTSGQSGPYAISVGSNGRVVLTNGSATSILYLISPTTSAAIAVSGKSTSPNVVVTQ